jgi:hypothetical protein
MRVVIERLVEFFIMRLAGLQRLVYQPAEHHSQ